MSADNAAAAPVLDTADAAADLLDLYAAPGGFLFTRSGNGIVGIGSAAHEVIAAGADQVGRAAAAAGTLLGAAGASHDAVVVGALPFDGSVAALLTMPSRVVRRVAGTAAPSLGTHRADTSEAAHTDRADSATGSVAWHGDAAASEPTPAAYTAAVADALRRISAGELRKVVLARSLVVPTPSPAALVRVLARLRGRDPHAHVFAAPIPGIDGHPQHVVAGASPELLLRRTGGEVISRPLAGTAPRSADAATDRDNAQRLLASVKESAEHRVVVEAVADTLAPFCSNLEVDRLPSLDRTATVWHLATAVHGRLRRPAPSALDLAAALHPTPAVGGMPRPAALSAIAELEQLPRGFYAGCVGWVDGAGDGEWVVTLRCIETGEHGTRIFAGAGIVAGSDPDAELAETAVKFETLLQALAAV